jgi:hypothetical protein
MTNQHPITPLSELLQLWFEQHHDYNKGINELLIEAAQYGADMELEACCEWLASLPNNWTSTALKRVSDLRAARRPKPPSLKKQALETLQRLSKDKYPCNYQEDSDWDTIRRALEALPDD